MEMETKEKCDNCFIPLPYKKAVVTGGAGFIGSHLCEELIKEGIEVISIDDYSAGYEKNIQHLNEYDNFKAVNGDITEWWKLEKYFKDVDVIFHNAASKKNICLKDPERDMDVNGKAVIKLLDLALKYKVKKFVHASTGSVYGEPKELPLTENSPLEPCSYYGVSKLAGERYVNLYNKMHGLDTTILRYFHVYGERQESNEFGGVVSIFMRNMANKEQPIIHGDGSQLRSFTYVKDVVKANIMASYNPAMSGQVYNCASGIKVSIKELYDVICGDTKPRYEDWLVGDIKDMEVSNDKIRPYVSFDTEWKGNIRRMINESSTNRS